MSGAYFTQITICSLQSAVCTIREAPFKKNLPLYLGIVQIALTPPRSVKQALWETFYATKHLDKRFDPSKVKNIKYAPYYPGNHQRHHSQPPSPNGNAQIDGALLRGFSLPSLQHVGHNTQTPPQQLVSWCNKDKNVFCCRKRWYNCFLLQNMDDRVVSCCKKDQDQRNFNHGNHQQKLLIRSTGRRGRTVERPK